MQLAIVNKKALHPNVFPDGHSECEPPNPISNLEVKPLSADDSVGSPHVKVGHCQGFILKTSITHVIGVFFSWVFIFLFPLSSCSPP